MQDYCFVIGSVLNNTTRNKFKKKQINMPHQKSNKVVQSRSAFACVMLWIFCVWLILSNFIKFHALHRTVPLNGFKRNQRMQDNKPPKKQMKPYTKNKTLPMIKWKTGVQHGTTLFVCQIPEYQVMFQGLSAPSLPQLLSQELSFICRLWLWRQGVASVVKLALKSQLF